MMNTMKTNAFRTLLLLVGLATFVPVQAQIDLSGTWASRMHEDWMDRWPGPDPVDFTGLPLNEDGQAKGLSYSGTALAIPERQCMYYPAHYTEIGPFGLHIQPQEDEITSEISAWHISGASDRSPRTIWMDGREHPPEEALHTYAGFSTGEWRGPTLVVTTTHLKTGVLRRNGPISSDNAVMTEYITRHDNLLTITLMIEDPAYLEEPHVISRGWVLDETTAVETFGGPCIPVVEAAGLEHGDVPHYLPGQNPLQDEFSDRYNIPLEAVLGGAETLYPEYRDFLKENYIQPQYCERFCCGWVNDVEGGLMCVTE